MNFDSTRAAMAKLNIDTRKVNDLRLEWPINNWLAETSKLNILAGAIRHPRYTSKEEDGILFMCRFIQAYCNEARDPVLIEEHSRDKEVKDWLMNEGGVKESEIEFVSMWDLSNLTRSGVIPTCNNIQGPSPPPIRATTEEEFHQWCAYRETHDPKPSLGQFMAMIFERRRSAV